MYHTPNIKIQIVISENEHEGNFTHQKRYISDIYG